MYRKVQTLYHITLDCMVLRCTVLCCTELCCTVLCCTVLYCAALYCAALYCAALYCAALYCAAWYCAALYYTYYILRYFLLVPEVPLVVLEGGEVAVHHLSMVPHTHSKPPDVTGKVNIWCTVPFCLYIVCMCTLQFAL